MKILHIGPVMKGFSDGLSRSICGLAGGHATLGHDVGLLPSEPSNLIQGNLPSNVRLLPCPHKKHINPWTVSKEWINIIKKHFGAPDIINFHDHYIPFQSALAKLFMREGWPYIHTPRGSLNPLAQKIKRPKKIIANWFVFNSFLKNAKAIHALTKNEAFEINFFYPNLQVFVIPNGVEESLFDIDLNTLPADIRKFRDNASFILGFMGRIDVYTKGLDLLLLSLKLLQEKEIGKKIKIILVGPFDDKRPNDKEKIKKLINSLKFPEHILLAGPLYGEDKWKMLKAFDVFILTSRHEGMPNVILEAMSFGKACLVTPGTNLQSMISEYKSGWLCDTNVQSIASTISEICGKQEEIEQRGANARAYVKKNLTWPKIAQHSVLELMKIL